MNVKKRTFDMINSDENKKLNTFDTNKKPNVPVPDRLKKTYLLNDNAADLKKYFMIMFPPNILNEPSLNPEGDIIKDINCKNLLCDHKTFEENPELVQIPEITNIKNIFDLITLGKSYHCKKNLTFMGMNLRLLCNLVQPLTELSKMVGMDSVKEHMVDQILFFLQGNHVSTKCDKCIDCSYGLPCVNAQTEMLHTVITGPPGVGKTELGKILGKVYKEIGILSTGKFKLVTRADLIAGYLGQTAIKTQKVIDECKGGVLFIDEAYSLGNSELRDSFSKECIDTLNQNLSEKRDFLCIIAGYKDALEKCFFNYNDGLRRRFTFKYDISSYKYDELLQIFEMKVRSIDWKLCYFVEPDDDDETIKIKSEYRMLIQEMFRKNKNNFPNFGGDIETLLLKCKIVHSRRCIFKNNELRKTLSIEDIKLGIDLFISHRKTKNNDDYTVNMYS